MISLFLLLKINDVTSIPTGFVKIKFNHCSSLFHRLLILWQTNTKTKSTFDLHIVGRTPK